MKKVCVCGGGNISHVAAGYIASHRQFEVTVLTRQPERWSRQLVIDRPDGPWLTGRLAAVSNDPAETVAGADVVVLCLPGFAIRPTLELIRPFVGPRTVVGSVVSSTGFFFQAMEVLPADVPLFGLQRVPFIARIVEYGHRAALLGYKDSLRVATLHTSATEGVRQLTERLFNTPTRLMDNFYEVSLTNSNPLLHPARLYNLWQGWQGGVVYDRVPLFYEEWTDEAAQLYIDMDTELHALVAALPVEHCDIPTVLAYYESADAPSLAAKLRSIAAFKGIAAPMKAVAGGYVPDFGSRYFTEDFPYGLAIVSRLAAQYGVAAPVVDRVCQWGMAHVSQ